MSEPNFNPESAVILHRSIFFSGITDRLLSEPDALSEYQNLHSALCKINAPKSEKALKEFLEIFLRFEGTDFAGIEEQVIHRENQIEELANLYLEADEDVISMIEHLCEDS